MIPNLCRRFWLADRLETVWRRLGKTARICGREQRPDWRVNDGEKRYSLQCDLVMPAVR